MIVSTIGKVTRSVSGLFYRQLEKTKTPFAIRYQDITIRLYPDGEIARLLYTNALWGRSRFEEREIDLLISLLGPGMTFVDVGANIGLFSLLASRKVGDTGTVLAFEPAAGTFERLRRNIELNGSSRIVCERVALSDRTANAASLVHPSGRGDGYCFLRTSGTGTLESNTESVRVLRLDDYAEEQDLRSIDVIKIDVEGGELSVLQGAKGILQRSASPVLLFECYPEWCNRSGTSPAAVFAWLRNAGFDVWRDEPRRVEWISVREYCPGTINYWAARDKSCLPSLGNSRRLPR